MASDTDERPPDVAWLLFQSTKTSRVTPNMMPITPNTAFDVGRKDVEERLKINDKTISIHHLRFRCILYEDEADTEVPPMIYMRVLSKNSVRLRPLAANTSQYVNIVRHSDGDVLLSHGDVVQLTASVTLQFKHDAPFTIRTREFTRSEEAEMSRFGSQYIVSNRILGWGGQADVYLAAEKLSGRQVACKLIRLPKAESVTEGDKRLNVREIHEQFKLTKKEAERRRNEQQRAVDILQNVSHPNITNLEKAIFTPDHIYCFEELITGGDLHSYVQKKGGLAEPEAAVITRQLLHAVAYLHENGIVHRDIKAENILMTSWREGARIVLTDFGHSRKLVETKAARKNGNPSRMHTIVGTHGYAAPEIFGGMSGHEESSGYSEAIDIFPVGCVTALLLTGYQLLPDQDRRASHSEPDRQEQLSDRDYIFNAIDERSEWTTIGRKAKSFVKACVEYESKRLTAKRGLEHVWFTDKHYAVAMEAAYRRAIQDWQPKRKQEPVVEVYEAVDYATTASNNRVVGDVHRGVKSRHFAGPNQVAAVKLNQPRFHVGSTHRYRKATPLPSVAEDAEMMDTADAMPAPHGSMQCSQSDRTQFSILPSCVHAAQDRIDIDGPFSIDDFAPPKTQITASIQSHREQSISER